MTDTTKWTPEARKIREAERAAARAAYGSGLYCGIRALSVDKYVDEKYPPPPPEYTYGREVKCHDSNAEHSHLRRRNDGLWQGKYRDNGIWENVFTTTDQYVRALAAEVPLTDKECEELAEQRAYWTQPHAFRDAVRAAFVRVMWGEVK